MRKMVETRSSLSNTICDRVRENQAFVQNISFRVFTGFRIVYHRYTIVAILKSIARSSPEIYYILNGDF